MRDLTEVLTSIKTINKRIIIAAVDAVVITSNPALPYDIPLYNALPVCWLTRSTELEPLPDHIEACAN